MKIRGTYRLINDPVANLKSRRVNVTIPSEAVIADTRDEGALRKAGVGNYDGAVIAIIENLEANVLATMNAERECQKFFAGGLASTRTKSGRRT